MPNDLRYAQQGFTRTGLVLLGLDVARLAIVAIILHQDGGRIQPNHLVGVLYLGALSLALGVGALGLGLLTA